MARRWLAWLLAVPLMFAGTETAHWLAFRLVYPNPWERAQALASSGHGYLLTYWPIAAGIGGAVSLAALALGARSHAESHDRPTAPPSALVFAALPPLAFALQEHLESLVHSGSISGVAESPTFIVGLALQLPFALAAFAAAWLLLRVARLVGARLGESEPRRAAGTWIGVLRPRDASMRSLVRLGAQSGRGPPLVA
jgi:hypothetical protein